MTDRVTRLRGAHRYAEAAALIRGPLDGAAAEVPAGIRAARESPGPG